MTNLGKRLISAAKEASAIARGEAAPGTFNIHIPAEIDVRRIRSKFKLSQTRFAEKFGFSAARIKDWEQGRSKPDGAVRAYLLVIAKEPLAVERALKRS